MRDSYFFNDTPTTEIYTLSLHDALPIFGRRRTGWIVCRSAQTASTSSPVIVWIRSSQWVPMSATARSARSEEHTSELQSRRDLVCRLLLEKKKVGHRARDGRPGGSHAAD